MERTRDVPAQADSNSVDAEPEARASWIAVPPFCRHTTRTIVSVAAAVLAAAAVADAQSSANAAPSQQDAQPPAVETMDVFDLWRKLRHKEDLPAEPWDYRKPMMAFAPVIGAKPSSGALVGAAGNVAFYLGEPSTTHISSAVASVTFSTKKQTAITNRMTTFGRSDRWRLDADHRFQWTSLETNELGTSADTRTSVGARFDFFRLHHTAYYRLGPGLHAGAGLYFDNHTNIRPSEGEDAGWADSPFVQYSTANNLPLESQTSAGTSLDLVWDTRDSFINANRGSLAKVGYRMLFDGFLGADSSWQKLTLDLRTYRQVSSSGRHGVAFWLFTDLVVNGVAPYLDLPGTGLDTYGRSARGYAEGQFRGEKPGLRRGRVSSVADTERAAGDGGVSQHDDGHQSGSWRAPLRQLCYRRRCADFAC